MKPTHPCSPSLPLSLSLSLSLAAIKKISLEPFDWIDTICAKIYFAAQSYRGCAPACTYHATIVSRTQFVWNTFPFSPPPPLPPSSLSHLLHIYTTLTASGEGKGGDPSEADIAREMHKSRALSGTIDIFAINYRNIKFVFTSRVVP
jgi:hypothetical protein